MSAVTFTFDEVPDVVYRADRDDNGFITLAVASAGGEFIDAGGISVNITPPPPVEGEPT